MTTAQDYLTDLGFDLYEWLEDYADILAQAEKLNQSNSFAEEE